MLQKKERTGPVSLVNTDPNAKDGTPLHRLYDFFFLTGDQNIIV